VNVFFQSNGKVLEKLIEDLINIVKKLPEKHRAGDFYSGVGTFSVFLQDYFDEIDLLEENKDAIALARRNIINEKAEFYALSDEKWLSANQKNKKTKKYDTIIIDPPRTGLAPSMRKWICDKGPPFLLYVSCDPSTLARDSRELVQGGYELKDLHLYDFYPQTAHIESLAVFVKGRTLL
jgi:23S rRNA (uracil1939-C5)-methyltransferase